MNEETKQTITKQLAEIESETNDMVAAKHYTTIITVATIINVIIIIIGISNKISFLTWLGIGLQISVFLLAIDLTLHLLYNILRIKNP